MEVVRDANRRDERWPRHSVLREWHNLRDLFSEVSISFCGRMRAPAARQIRLHCAPGCRGIDHVPYRKHSKSHFLIGV